MRTRARAYLPPELPAARLVAALGLVSDTHMPARCPALPPALFEVLDGVDLLLHAGDLGELWVLDRLSEIAPVIAVHGNDETADAQRELPYQQLLTVAGRRILLCHSHYPDRAEELGSRRDDAWGPKLARRAALGRRAGASIVVFGHTHIPMAYQSNGVLLVNPGAVASGSWTTRQRPQTVALLLLHDDGGPFVVHVDLHAPERAFVPRIDWQAGFRAALDQFSESLLSPELVEDWERLRELGERALEQSSAALHRVAWRCWSGEQTLITPADLLAELRAEQSLPPGLLAEFEATLSRR